MLFPRSAICSRASNDSLPPVISGIRTPESVSMSLSGPRNCVDGRRLTRLFAASPAALILQFLIRNGARHKHVQSQHHHHASVSPLIAVVTPGFCFQPAFTFIKLACHLPRNILRTLSWLRLNDDLRRCLNPVNGRYSGCTTHHRFAAFRGKCQRMQRWKLRRGSNAHHSGNNGSQCSCIFSGWSHLPGR